MKNRYICPSLLSVPTEKRIEVANRLLEMGIEWIHYDIMDNEFVKNKAIEPEEYINILQATPAHLSDIHLMVNDPFIYAEKLKDYATCMTIHYESMPIDKILEFVKKYQEITWIGLAIKPGLNWEEIKPIIHHFEIILIMSVEPGFGGQTFIDESIEKINNISNFIKENKLQTIIQVDGGINNNNSKKAFLAGATALVCGSYLTNNLSEKTLKKLY